MPCRPSATTFNFDVVNVIRAYPLSATIVHVTRVRPIEEFHIELEPMAPAWASHTAASAVCV